MNNKGDDKITAILVAGGDPGGANALAPVIEAMSKDPTLAIYPFAYNEAGNIWKARGIAVIEIPDRPNNGFFLDIMRDIHPDLLLTATSYNTKEYEKCFIKVAKKSGIPSICVMDFWSYYSVRFSNQEGDRIFLPDRIAVMDERAKEEMIKEGFSPESLVITGQPAYDDLGLWRRRFNNEKRINIINDIGVEPGNLIVVFASEFQFGPVSGEQWYQGYKTEEVLNTLINALDTISEETHKKITLVIRPHPRENPRDFDNYLGCRIQVIVSEKDHSRNLVMASDLVTGMTTNLLIEACYLGCIVASLQPGPRQNDPVITNRLGFSRGVYDKKEFKPVIQQLLLDTVTRREMEKKLTTFQTDGQAASRIINLIHHMLKNN